MNIDEIMHEFTNEFGGRIGMPNDPYLFLDIFKYVSALVQKERKDAYKEGYIDGLKANVSLTDAIRKDLLQTKGGKESTKLTEE